MGLEVTVRFHPKSFYHNFIQNCQHQRVYKYLVANRGQRRAKQETYANLCERCSRSWWGKSNWQNKLVVIIFSSLWTWKCSIFFSHIDLILKKNHEGDWQTRTGFTWSWTAINNSQYLKGRQIARIGRCMLMSHLYWCTHHRKFTNYS